MSFNEEKMMILKMLQEGKINSEEAARLLEALEGGRKSESGPDTRERHWRHQQNYQDEISKLRDRLGEWKNDFQRNYNEKDFDKVIDDFTNKAEKFGKNVATTTFGIVDKMVDYVSSAVDTGAFNIFGTYDLNEKSYEAPAFEGMDIYLEAANGPVTVKKHMDDKIVINAKIRRPMGSTEEALIFENTEGTLSLKPIQKDFISVSYEVFLPILRFNKLKLETKNGKIHVEDALAHEFEAITKNAMIELMGVNSDKILVDTKNAKVMLGYVIGKQMDINTKNSIIDIRNIKTENLNACTANGRIGVENIQHLDSSNEISLALRTKNGGIKANMNDMDNTGYKVAAKTTNGSINLLIPDLLYSNPNKANMEAQTGNYTTAPQRVNIYAETQNGFIEIVK